LRTWFTLRSVTAGAKLRVTDETTGSLFSYVDLEERIPARHPLRTIRQVVNDALASLDAEFEALYTDFGRPSIPPERLIRASLLQFLFSVRSERQLMEQIDYNLLFRWFVGPMSRHTHRTSLVPFACRGSAVPQDGQAGSRFPQC
jgi:transposase